MNISESSYENPSPELVERRLISHSFFAALYCLKNAKPPILGVVNTVPARNRSRGHLASFAAVARRSCIERPGHRVGRRQSVCESVKAGCLNPESVKRNALPGKVAYHAFNSPVVLSSADRPNPDAFELVESDAFGGVSVGT